MAHRELLDHFMTHYLPKTEVMYRLPVSVPLEGFWPELLDFRRKSAVTLPLRSWDGHAYWYVPTRKFLEAGDAVAATARSEAVSLMPQYASEEGVIDEAYFSSLIEGAYTTRQRAREFILSGESPKDRGERMILNNYAALRFVLDHADGPINEALVLEIARILTDGTLADGAKPGWRDAGVQVISGRQAVVYTAPDARYVRPMMDTLLGYLNDPGVHPVVKACAAHIYFVTAHPLFDGNGRTARALAYMILLRAGYTFFRQVPVSGLLSEERSKYYKAIRAAQDPENDYDFTYFMEYYAGMLARSAAGIHRRVADRRRLDALADRVGRDDDRLIRGARWLLEENVESITTEKWRVKFRISFETARKDLTALEAAGLLRLRVEGRKHIFEVIR